MGCDTLDIEGMVVHARRVGNVQGKRLPKVECNTVKDKERIYAWRDELKNEGNVKRLLV